MRSAAEFLRVRGRGIMQEAESGDGVGMHVGEVV